MLKIFLYVMIPGFLFGLITLGIIIIGAMWVSISKLTRHIEP